MTSVEAINEAHSVLSSIHPFDWLRGTRRNPEFWIEYPWGWHYKFVEGGQLKRIPLGR